MPVIFSKSCEYAIQAVLYIAKKGDSPPIHLKIMSQELNIPHHFLSKVLQTLVRYEIIQSYKGQNGGFALARSANDITLSNIVLAIDGTSFLSHCVMGFPGCYDELPCPLHEQWKEAKKIIHSMVTEKTISELEKTIFNKVHLLEMLSQKQQHSTQQAIHTGQE